MRVRERERNGGGTGTQGGEDSREEAHEGSRAAGHNGSCSCVVPVPVPTPTPTPLIQLFHFPFFPLRFLLSAFPFTPLGPTPTSPLPSLFNFFLFQSFIIRTDYTILLN